MYKKFSMFTFWKVVPVIAMLQLKVHPPADKRNSSRNYLARYLQKQHFLQVLCWQNISSENLAEKIKACKSLAEFFQGKHFVDNCQNHKVVLKLLQDRFPRKYFSIFVLNFFKNFFFISVDRVSAIRIQAIYC